MDKIDRLGWAAGVAFQVFGVRIGIRVSDPLVREPVLSRVPAGWTRIQSAVVDRLYSIVTPLIHRRNVRHLCVLYGDHTRLSRTEHIEDLLDNVLRYPGDGNYTDAKEVISQYLKDSDDDHDAQLLQKELLSLLEEPDDVFISVTGRPGSQDWEFGVPAIEKLKDAFSAYIKEIG